MRWGRRRGGPGLSPDGRRVVHRAAGLCLDYPDQALYERLPLIRAAVRETGAPVRKDAAAVRKDGDAARKDGGRPALRALRAVAEFAAELESRPLLRAQEHYVSVFDTRNRRTLYLTWWTDGDTRRRGSSLATLKQRYRARGLTPPEGAELPDYLPVVLEYAALEPDDGTALLTEHRGALELIRFALADAGTPYALLLEAVCATLPGPSPASREQARAMIRRPPAAGPELVGLEAPGLLPGHPLLPSGPAPQRGRGA
ncbi:nitrate reductase molybdenum cofactor assembly chaperone [Nonomuraea phyllanthi]|uniref:nitrate reductase molybdenum cofactor assembly chaperone n=1 Tax=Nonomuraea phyllanthi TaxID=2219224 RepID=UPI001D14A8DC|nr:nitrate reductase molybdenum cofactor assembly chaperone [Nonomuraea phyllanthi]